MNKAVMLSIRPKWCALIASGKKTVEVRKTRPNIETTFKCYIYETQAESDAPWVDEDGHFIYKGRGAVIGEFVCDHVMPIFNNTLLSASIPDELMLENLSPCLTDREIKEYLGNRSRGYGWHISDLVIYNTPRPLSDFGLTRPPQSWCYVQEVNK